MSGNKPNKFVHYVDAHDESKILYTDYFYDSGLQWYKPERVVDYILIGIYGGEPTPEWLKENPKPRR